MYVVQTIGDVSEKSILPDEKDRSILSRWSAGFTLGLCAGALLMYLSPIGKARK